jgi:hypothetical protein
MWWWKLCRWCCGKSDGEGYVARDIALNTQSLACFSVLPPSGILDLISMDVLPFGKCSSELGLGVTSRDHRPGGCLFESINLGTGCQLALELVWSCNLLSLSV